MCWSGRVIKHTSALLSAFLSRLSRNTADFLGHRAWPLVLCSFLACRQQGCVEKLDAFTYWHQQAPGYSRQRHTAICRSQLRRCRSSSSSMKGEFQLCSYATCNPT